MPWDILLLRGLCPFKFKTNNEKDIKRHLKFSSALCIIKLERGSDTKSDALCREF